MVFSVFYVYQSIILVMLYHALPWLNYVCKGQIHGYLKLIESVTPSPKPLINRRQFPITPVEKRIKWMYLCSKNYAIPNNVGDAFHGFKEPIITFFQCSFLLVSAIQ